jgi:hypothetical protein
MKKIAHIIVVLIVLSIFSGCKKEQITNEKVILSERESYKYEKALKDLENLEFLCKQVSEAPTVEIITSLLKQSKDLKYNYNEVGMNLATIQHCDSLKKCIENSRERAETLARQVGSTIKRVNLVNVREQLLSEKTYYPIYLKKGEYFFCDVEASAALAIKFYNADTERLIKSYSKSSVSDSLLIKNTGIYLLEVVPKGKQHVTILLGIRPIEADGVFKRPEIVSEKVPCKKSDWGAFPVPGVSLHKCFEEPRKFTLRGQLKAAFSGNSRGLIAVNVPPGATDILYSMRIDTSESSRTEDGKFHDNLTRSYKRIKFLGLPLYEKTTSNGLLNTLLDDNRPVREEDAYCNMYVFRSQKSAKQFQDGCKSASQLDYDVDYSTVGTQSCNGRIPTKNSKIIYLAFENERIRYTNYLWVEVEAVVPHTEYYKIDYKLSH